MGENHNVVLSVARVVELGKCSWNPGVNVFLRKGKMRRHNPNDGISLDRYTIIEANLVTDNASVARKTLLPQSETEQHHVFVSRTVFVLSEQPSDERIYSEHRKKVPCDAFFGQRAWFTAVCLKTKLISSIDGSYILKYLPLPLEVGIPARCIEVIFQPQVAAAMIFVNLNQPIGISIGQRPQKDGVYKTEGGSGRSDTQGQCKQGRKRKSRRFPQLPKSKSAVG